MRMQQNSVRIVLAICACLFAACDSDDAVRNEFVLAPVNAVELSVDKAKFTGKCPHSFKFSADVSTRGGGRVGYRFHEVGDDLLLDPWTIASGSLEFSSPGSQTLSLEFAVTRDGTSDVVLDVTGANPISSNSLQVTATCQ